MMTFKERLGYICPFIIFTAIAIVGISSCARMGSEPEVRLEGKFDNYGGVGVKPTYFLTFDGPRSIRRVVIHTEGIVKNVEIYVRVTPERWRQVKQLMTPLSATADINIGREGMPFVWFSNLLAVADISTKLRHSVL